MTDVSAMLLSGMRLQHVPVHFQNCASDQLCPGIAAFQRGGSELVMSEGKGLGWGVAVLVLRIPEEASQELTRDGAKYVFVLTAKPGGI